jgi:hypothetical protein
VNRRGFLTGLFASAAIVRADRLMPVRAPAILLYGDGVGNDAPAFQAMIAGRRVWDVARRGWLQARDNNIYIPPGDYLLTSQVLIDTPGRDIDFAGSRIDASRMPDGRAAFQINADDTTMRRARIGSRGPPFPGAPVFVPPMHAGTFVMGTGANAALEHNRKPWENASRFSRLYPMKTTG